VAFRDGMPAFDAADATILGVSPDDVAKHAKFAGKYELPFPLLADSARDADGAPVVCAKFGVWQEKSMYGRKSMGVVRTTYLIDARGRVARRWDRVKVADHAEEVRAALEAVAGG